MGKTLLKPNKVTLFLQLMLLAAPFAIGGYHIAVSAVYTIILSVYAVAEVIFDNDAKTIKLTFPTAVSVFAVISFLAVSVWAVDSGTAIYGFIKYLPVPIFAVIVSQYSSEQREEAVSVIPYGAALMTLISFPLSGIKAFESFFLVAGRLGGFFQYPNTYALYCLVGLAVVVTNKKAGIFDIAVSLILSAGIFLSGSRSVFVLAALVVLFALFKPGKIKNKLPILGTVCLIVIVVAVYIFVSGNTDTIGRFLTISTGSSTLLGRLLYWKDALPVILKNPFGLGYYGYYYTQSSFQTGVYSVVNAHNEYVQMLLDIGWLPTIASVVTLGFSLFSKTNSVRNKLIMFLIAAHSFFDFDLQFVSVVFILLLTFDYKELKLKPIKLNELFVSALSAALILISLYFGVVNAAFLMGRYEFVEKIYGKDTQSELRLIVSETDYETMEIYADRIIKRNGEVALAYDVKANVAYSKSDFENFVRYKKLAISKSRYSIEEYNDYCKKLIYGIDLYTKYNNESGILYCKNALSEVPDMLKNVEEKTDDLGWRIQDKPDLKLNEEVQERIGDILNNE